ncbi:ribonuclease P protein component [Roseinatronobacter alkalisoli]|uniref:Ribonuclease P protein component n=1 Tax=Roseinatronobacter alkalisoli TaxID=3028235 RepID=A0ABT5TCI4_9RHOB|nr:ribonuclease P protein component [Roseinatronobacter sp. HJB301]MDD7971628.1 ribonuclease P protein component [Roseinatronobacter sp. HJB301]
MTPPKADVAGQAACAANASAVLSYAKPAVIKKRTDFLRAAKAKRVPCPAFLVQACPRGDEATFRVGFTCSKKVGNAVIRNRAKRRLREIARMVMARHGRVGWDYVLVGRPDATVSRDFSAMCDDLERALKKLHGPAR